MPPPDPNDVARLVRRLTTAVNATSSEEADARFDRILLRAVKSPSAVEATFAAVQALRDMGTIDRYEAAFLLDDLFGYLERAEMDDDDRPPDPNFDRAVRELDPDLLLIAMVEEDRVRRAAFLRDRGEVDQADLLLNAPDDYDMRVAEGEVSLLGDKPSRRARKERQPLTADPRVVSERALALSSAVGLKDWMREWRQLTRALRDVDPDAAVEVIQGLRDVGAISFNESLVLIALAIDPLVDDAMEGDREVYRLDREIERLDRLNRALDQPDGSETFAEQTPEIIALERARLRRIDGLTAGVLRQFGEHRMANLLIANPEEYSRIRDEEKGGR